MGGSMGLTGHGCGAELWGTLLEWGNAGGGRALIRPELETGTVLWPGPPPPPADEPKPPPTPLPPPPNPGPGPKPEPAPEPGPNVEPGPNPGPGPKPEPEPGPEPGPGVSGAIVAADSGWRKLRRCSAFSACWAMHLVKSSGSISI